MDNAPTQSLDLIERYVHVANGEVGKRDRVTRSGPTLVDPELGIPAMRLPAAALGLVAIGQLNAEQTRPEPARAVGIIGWELDQGERSVHSQHDNAGRARWARLQPADCRESFRPAQWEAE